MQFLKQFGRKIVYGLNDFLGVFHAVFFDSVREIVLSHHSCGLRLHPEVDVLGDEGSETSGIIVPDPYCSGENPVVLDVVVEKVLHIVREGVVRLDLDVAETLAERDSGLAEHLPFGEPVDQPHEAPCIETQGIIAFLELVQLLYHGNRNDNVIVLELLDRLVVVQDDIGVEHEDFRFPGRLSA